MKSITLYMLFVLFSLVGCSNDTTNADEILSSGEGKPYLITITNNCKDADLLLWCEPDYLKYNETSDIIEGHKDTAEIAFRWSDKDVNNPSSYWDTIKFVMKTKTDVNNFKIGK